MIIDLQSGEWDETGRDGTARHSAICLHLQLQLRFHQWHLLGSFAFILRLRPQVATTTFWFLVSGSKQNCTVQPFLIIILFLLKTSGFVWCTVILVIWRLSLSLPCLSCFNINCFFIFSKVQIRIFFTEGYPMEVDTSPIL